MLVAALLSALLANDITTRNIPSLIMETMAHQGITITNLFALTGISTIMSNLVSNVPAAMFLVRFLDPGGRSSGMSWPWQAPLPET